MDDQSFQSRGGGPKSLVNFLVLLLCGAAIAVAILNWRSSEMVRETSGFAPAEQNGS